MFVKTCGMKTAEAAAVAVGAGADALGFILAPSKRQVTVELVATISASLRTAHSALPPFAAVTVNPTDAQIADIAESEAFGILQLSGDEDRAILERIPASLAVWKVFRPGPEETASRVLHAIAPWLEGPRPAARIMLDAFHPGAYGGSGTVGNWALAAEVAARYPIVLAGGLNPENVADAIAQVGPYGVDVSSGIETEGVKDRAKIVAFVRAARTAAQTIGLQP
jgi:phosphoribosylanthranilate isomerase